MKISVLKTCLGLLAAGFAASAHADSTASRTSAFEYDPATGVILREIIEPAVSDLCLVTEYLYDTYGNKREAKTRNCEGLTRNGVIEAAAPPLPPTGNARFTSRISKTTYASGAGWAAGQFPTTSENALQQQEQKEYDAKFGSLTKLTGPNLLATRWEYDAFGRKSKEIRADNTETTWTYTRCDPCNDTWRYFVTTASTGAPTAVVYYDKLNREIRSESQGFDGALTRKDTEYDAQGRVLRVSQPYIAGQLVKWTTYTYDILGRVLTKTEPYGENGAMSSVTYNGLSVTTTNALGQSETRLKNSQGQLIRVTRQ